MDGSVRDGITALGGIERQNNVTRKHFKMACRETGAGQSHLFSRCV